MPIRYAGNDNRITCGRTPIKSITQGETAIYGEDLVAQWIDEIFVLDDSSNTVSVTGLTEYGKTLQSIQIPSIYRGKAVTNIGNEAFDGATNITSVVIPDSVTSIGYYAFRDCSGLTSITIPDSVTSINHSAFEDCISLTSVTIGNSVTSIKSWTFRNCTSLTSVTIPDSVTSIGDYAFSRCTSLTSVTIGNGVTSIWEYAFYNCSGLTSVTMGNSVTRIGEYAFQGCDNLQYNEDDNALYLGNDENQYMVFIRAKDKWTTSVDINASTKLIYPHAFASSLITSIAIPDSVTGIGDYAFSSCDSLKSVTIPDSVTRIEEHAFWDCASLTSVAIGNGVTSIGEDAFGSCSSLEGLTVADSNTVYHSAGNCIIETATKTLVVGCKSSVIPDDGSVTSIGNDAFAYCTSLKSVGIPNSVTRIGDYAFSNCTSFWRVTIPDSVTRIGRYAFQGCTSLESVDFSGTKAEWNAITKGSLWNDGCPFRWVHCSDGSVHV